MDQQIPFGDTPLSRCDYYRQVCDLPAMVDPPTTGRIIVYPGVTGAVIMPAVLGVNVKGLMENRGERLGPIVSHPRSRRWTFLIEPDLPEEMSLFAEMFRLNVSVLRGGATIALPSPMNHPGNNFRVWTDKPTTSYRPSGVVVVDAIRGCVDQRRARKARAYE